MFKTKKICAVAKGIAAEHGRATLDMLDHYQKRGGSPHRYIVRSWFFPSYIGGSAARGESRFPHRTGSRCHRMREASVNYLIRKVIMNALKPAPIDPGS